MYSNIKTIFNALTILIFCLAVFIPPLIGAYQKDKLYSQVEKRKLSKIPQLPPQNIKDFLLFPEMFESYFSDHFGLRNWFIKQYKSNKFHLGDSPSADITIGKNGWLFLGSIKHGYKSYGKIFDDYRNISLYSANQLEKTALYLEGLRLWLKHRNIEYLFFIAPNKHTIYSEYLPSYITKVNKFSATDQLINYLRQHTKVKVVDLRENLLKAKESSQVYFKKDTHWNYVGSNIVQFQLIKEIGKMFPNQFDPQLFNTQDKVTRGGDLVGMMGPFILSNNNKPYLKNDPQPTFDKTYCSPIGIPVSHKQIFTSFCTGRSLKTLIYRDSFFNRLIPYFSRQFKQLTSIFTKSNYVSLKQQISIEKPDIVIEEWAERNLPYLPKDYDTFFRYLKIHKFKSSDKLLFSNNWSKLRLSKQLKYIGLNNDVAKFESVEKDPKIYLPPIPFEKYKKYMLHIKIISSVKSSLHIFYSDYTKPKPQYTQNNSESFDLKKGDNDLYLPLKNINLDKYLRIDPIYNKGVIQISTLEIKQVESLLIK